MKQQRLTPEEWAELARNMRQAEDHMFRVWDMLQAKSTKHDKAFVACLKACDAVQSARIVELDNRWLRENPDKSAGQSPLLGEPRS